MSVNKGTAGMVSMGAAIGLCAAAGVVIGALLNSVVFGLIAGAAVGVLIGAVLQLRAGGRP